MQVAFFTPGPTRRPFYRDGIGFYLERIRRLWPNVIYQELSAGSGTTAEHTKEKESALLAERIQKGDRVVVLDEQSQLFTTEAFARQWQQWLHQSIRRLVFLSGGAYGVTQALRDKAHMVMALSPLTFPHELARLIWAEQFYRALTLWKGLPYHH